LERRCKFFRIKSKIKMKIHNDITLVVRMNWNAHNTVARLDVLKTCKIKDAKNYVDRSWKELPKRIQNSLIAYFK
jgi:hypothetical protein